MKSEQYKTPASLKNYLTQGRSPEEDRERAMDAVGAVYYMDRKDRNEMPSEMTESWLEHKLGPERSRVRQERPGAPTLS